MADRDGQDLLHKLQERGQEALGKLADAPGGAQIMDTVRTMRERMDDLQKRMLGVDALEKRVKELERRLATLEGKGPKVAKPPAPKPRAAAKPRTPKPKPPAA
jgi:polyhydroxyalkanoate synthesis regulator phasin